jgi:uncharacterized phage-associated protein
MFRPVHAAELILRATGPQTAAPLRICHVAHLCDGWHRAIHGTPLIDGVLIAEDVGPMYREIVETIQDPKLGFDPRPAGPGFTPDQAEVVMRTISKYAAFTTAELRDIVTAPGTPWHTTYLSPQGRHARIPEASIGEHFVALAKAGRRNSAARDALLSA